MRTVSVVEIAKELKVEPAIARRKLRAAIKQHPKGGRWVFDTRQTAKIKKIIKS